MISSLLTKLLKKYVPFIWTEKCQESFETLKKILTGAPVLVQPESVKEYALYSDAPHNSLGCVLMQEGKENVVADALTRKTFTALRTLNVCLSLKENDALLVELRIKSMLLDRIKEIEKKDGRCLERISQVEKGKENVVVDAPSRKTFVALQTLNACLSLKENGALLVELRINLMLLDRIKERREMLGKDYTSGNGETKDLEVKSDGCLHYRGRICILHDDELKKYIIS
ncbi:uncharacterized protein LOC120199218 [Hibiscus syriacus]|uniref:uncharacterized protein LOC120199218 n=1 Tax=Hibiscus syriacus TaxID=106335 RepID=UPI001924CE4C|nr:uncharacterized protein LOC120199218 [Hibiscus syriacus]